MYAKPAFDMLGPHFIAQYAMAQLPNYPTEIVLEAHKADY